MKIDKNKSVIEFKRELIEKYDKKIVNAPGHLASALTTFQYISLFIKDNISIEEEENIIYSYLNGECNQKQVKNNLNSIQEEFVMNCQIDIINNSPNLFKQSTILTKDGINMSILALGTLGSSMGDHRINDQYSVKHLQEDLFFLYFKMYFNYLKSNRTKITLDPNNQYKAEVANQQNEKNGKGGCLSVLFLVLIVTVSTYLLV